MNTRKVQQVISGQATTDGAGVELVRVIGQPALMDLDPFLLLDAFRSDDPDDYIAGFPPHPHRGFETVTYLLNGRMRHQDNAGNEGVIEPGGIQWMTAGKGIVHSEMPEQQDGLLEGFQLWVNLPAGHKMDPAAYQEYSAEQIPLESREAGVEVRVITGVTSLGTTGPVVQPMTEIVDLATDRYEEEPLSDVSLEELVVSVAERLERRNGRQVEMTSDASVVHGRPEALERAVANIIANADKWSPEGAPISVDIEDGSVTVEDAGPGIPDSDLAHVFERFYRADAARTTPGSGLGLSIVDQIVSDHHGAVFARNADSGSGAVVGFSLPVVAS